MSDITLDQIETVIAEAKPEQQQRLLSRLPRLLKLSTADSALLQLSEGSFDFWDNQDDAIYDQL